jgi:thiol-disulfide isomerase/thioredoxin
MNKDENIKNRVNLRHGGITSVNFKTEVLEFKRPVLVGFWSPWSQPCQVFDSVLQDVARDLAGTFKVVKVNADDNRDLRACFENILGGLAAGRGGWLRCSSVADFSRISAPGSARFATASSPKKIPVMAGASFFRASRRRTNAQSM